MRTCGGANGTVNDEWRMGVANGRGGAQFLIRHVGLYGLPDDFLAFLPCIAALKVALTPDAHHSFVDLCLPVSLSRRRDAAGIDRR